MLKSAQRSHSLVSVLKSTAQKRDYVNSLPRTRVNGDAYLYEGRSPTLARLSETVDKQGTLLEYSDVALNLFMHRPLVNNSLNSHLTNVLYKRIQVACSSVYTKGVVLQGYGPKAFCAGTDMKELYNLGMEGNHSLQAHIIREQCKLSYFLADSLCPVVTFVNGYATGMGFGLAAHAKYSVATDNAVVAVPEPSYGLVPHNGTTFLLARAPQKGLGMFMALTGCPLKAQDIVYAKFMNGFSLNGLASGITDSMKSLQVFNADTIDNCVKSILSTHIEYEFTLAKYEAAMERCFYNKESLEQILEALDAEKEQKKWADKAKIAIMRCSPLALKLTFEAVKRAEHLTKEQCYKMEYRLVARLLRNPDFYEGVRRTLFEKTTPNWSVKSFKDVTQEVVESYFAPLDPFEDHCADLEMPHEATYHKSLWIQVQMFQNQENKSSQAPQQK